MATNERLYQNELTRRINGSEFNFVDNKIVDQVITLIMEKAAKAKKKDLEIDFPYPLSEVEESAIKTHLQNNHGNFSKRISFLKSEDRDGATTLIQIKKKGA